MPQALKTLCLIHFWGWENSLFPLLALWGNKNWPPSMKVKMMENFQNKRGLKGCKWSSLNCPCTENPMSQPFLVNLGSLLPIRRKGKCPGAVYHQVAGRAGVRVQKGERGVVLRKAAAKISPSFLKLLPIQKGGTL